MIIISKIMNQKKLWFWMEYKTILILMREKKLNKILILIHKNGFQVSLEKIRKFYLVQLTIVKSLKKIIANPLSEIFNHLIRPKIKIKIIKNKYLKPINKKSSQLNFLQNLKIQNWEIQEYYIINKNLIIQVKKMVRNSWLRMSTYFKNKITT